MKGGLLVEDNSTTRISFEINQDPIDGILSEDNIILYKGVTPGRELFISDEVPRIGTHNF